jgi:hypothetical protein
MLSFFVSTATTTIYPSFNFLSLPTTIAIIISTITASDFISKSSVNHAAIYLSKSSTIVTAISSTIEPYFKTSHSPTIRATIISTITAADIISKSSANHAINCASKSSTIVTAVGSIDY